MLLFFLLFMIALYVLLLWPVYVIGQRTGVKSPGVAFVPLLGAAIVFMESMGRSGWLSLIAFVPYVGPLVLLVWIAVEVPMRHERSGWWTLGLMVPPVNLVTYWFYAFTLPIEPQRYAFAA